MSGVRHTLRDERGRFAAARPEPGMELKRAWGDRAGNRPQIRRRHRRALTEAEIDAFLSTLAETCNITHSARTVGRAERVFRDLKKRDPAFAAAWMKALRESYDLLELEMGRRARFGTHKDIFNKGQRVGRIRVFNDGMALRLLSLHRKSVERMREADEAPGRDPKALFDELAARLAEIKAEKAKNADGGEDGRG